MRYKAVLSATAGRYCKGSCAAFDGVEEWEEGQEGMTTAGEEAVAIFALVVPGMG